MVRHPVLRRDGVAFRKKSVEGEALRHAERHAHTGQGRQLRDRSRHPAELVRLPGGRGAQGGGGEVRHGGDALDPLLRPNRRQPLREVVPGSLFDLAGQDAEGAHLVAAATRVRRDPKQEAV